MIVRPGQVWKHLTPLKYNSGDDVFYTIKEKIDPNNNIHNTREPAWDFIGGWEFEYNLLNPEKYLLIKDVEDIIVLEQKENSRLGLIKYDKSSLY